jgi:hypothetical protein
MIHSVFVALFLLASVPALAYECSKPPEQVTHDVATELRSSSMNLVSATSNSFANVARTVSRDLLVKYPNADQVLIQYAMISMFCQVIMGGSFSDAEKLDRLYQLDDWMWHASRRSTPSKLSDTTSCATTSESVLQPIRALFSAWSRLDVETYLAQWGPDAIHRSKFGVLGMAKLAEKRRGDFAKYTRVEVLSVSPKAIFADGRKAIVNNSYTMRFWRSKSSFAESENENYTLECSKAQQRWIIRENNDYLPDWAKS